MVVAGHGEEGLDDGGLGGDGVLLLGDDVEELSWGIEPQVAVGGGGLRGRGDGDVAVFWGVFTQHLPFFEK